MDKTELKKLTIANNELARQLAINSFSKNPLPLTVALREIGKLAFQQLKKEKQIAKIH